MAFKTRIYETNKIGKGKRIVTSGTISDYFFLGLVKFFFKIIYFITIGWVIWLVKLFIRKK